MNYSVMVKTDPNSLRSVRYNVSREGNNVSVSDTSANGSRNAGDDYYLTLGQDTITIRSLDKHFDIEMSPDGVTVSDPRAVGSRNGAGKSITGFATEMPLRPEQYEQVGLSIASSLIGIPLVFPQS